MSRVKPYKIDADASQAFTAKFKDIADEIIQFYTYHGCDVDDIVRWKATGGARYKFQNTIAPKILHLLYTTPLPWDCQEQNPVWRIFSFRIPGGTGKKNVVILVSLGLCTAKGWRHYGYIKYSTMDNEVTYQRYINHA